MFAREFAARGTTEIAELFGREFALRLAEIDEGNWVGTYFGPFTERMLSRSSLGFRRLSLPSTMYGSKYLAIL